MRKSALTDIWVLMYEVVKPSVAWLAICLLSGRDDEGLSE